jgi:hypothetical protein
MIAMIVLNEGLKRFFGRETRREDVRALTYQKSSRISFAAPRFGNEKATFLTKRKN